MQRRDIRLNAISQDILVGSRHDRLLVIHIMSLLQCHPYYRFASVILFLRQKDMDSRLFHELSKQAAEMKVLIFGQNTQKYYLLDKISVMNSMESLLCSGLSNPSDIGDKNSANNQSCLILR